MFDAELVRMISRLSGISLALDRAEVVAAEFSDLWPGLQALTDVEVGATEPAPVIALHSARERS